MRDRRRQFDEIFLQRTAGPYIGVNRVVPTVRRSLPVYPDKQTFSVPVGMSQKCQNRTFVAGFLTSNARHAERSNDRCPVLPHRPRLSRSTASAGSPTMISWAHLAQPPEWLVAFWPIAFFERMPSS